MSRKKITIEILRCLTGSIVEADYLLGFKNSSVITIYVIFGGIILMNQSFSSNKYLTNQQAAIDK
jgi:hypothetical protein